MVKYDEASGSVVLVCDKSVPDVPREFDDDEDESRPGRRYGYAFSGFLISTDEDERYIVNIY